MANENTISPYLALLNSLQTYRDNEGEAYPRVANLSPSADSICDIDLNSRSIALPSEKYALTTDIIYSEDKVYYHKIIENGKTAYVEFPYTIGREIKDDGEAVYERYSGFLSVQYEHNAEIIYFRCPRYYENMDLATTVCVVEYLNAQGQASLYWVPFYDIEHYSVAADGTEEPVIIFPWAINGMVTAYEGDVTFVVRFYQLMNNGTNYYFNMSTQPTVGKVLHGMDIKGVEPLADLIYDVSIQDQILNQISQGLQQVAIYWKEAT